MAKFCDKKTCQPIELIIFPDCFEPRNYVVTTRVAKTQWTQENLTKTEFKKKYKEVTTTHKT